MHYHQGYLLQSFCSYFKHRDQCRFVVEHPILFPKDSLSPNLCQNCKQIRLNCLQLWSSSSTRLKKTRVGSLKQSLTNSRLVIAISALNIYMLKLLFTSSHLSVNEDHIGINIKCSKVNFVVLQKCGKGGIFQIHCCKSH